MNVPEKDVIYSQVLHAIDGIIFPVHLHRLWEICKIYHILLEKKELLRSGQVGSLEDFWEP